MSQATNPKVKSTVNDAIGQSSLDATAKLDKTGTVRHAQAEEMKELKCKNESYFQLIDELKEKFNVVRDKRDPTEEKGIRAS